MRTLSATLTANQKGMVAQPRIKVVLSKTGETSVAYVIDPSRASDDAVDSAIIATTNPIISINHTEQEWSQIAHIAILGDSTLTATDYEGWTATISYGYYDTTEGDEYSACAPLEVVAQRHDTLLDRKGIRVVVYLTCAGVFDMMGLDAASEAYTQESDDSNTVKTLLTAIAGTTLTPFDHCNSYTITFDSEDSLIDTYIPADYFQVGPGESRLSAFKKLIETTKCEARIEDDGEIHVFNPTVSGTSYNYTYELGQGNHNFFEKNYRKRLVIPNQIMVESYPTHSTLYSGSATDTDSYTALGRYIRSKPYYVRATGNAQCNSIAAAILQKKQLEADKGGGVVPMNCGQEVIDYVKMVDSIASDNRIGNVSYINRKYVAGKISPRMEIKFGAVGGGYPFMTGEVAEGQPYCTWQYANELENTIFKIAYDLTNMILGGGIDGQYILNGSIPAVSLIDEIIDASKLADDAVETAKIANDAVTAIKTNLAGIDGTSGRVVIADATDANAITGGVNNYATTFIAPGKVLISGGTVLEDWRHSSDNTYIDGGKLYNDSVTTAQINVLGLDGATGRIVVADQTDADEVTGGINSHAVTLVNAGKILISGSTTLDDWGHASDATLIDGGDIYTGSVNAHKINVAAGNFLDDPSFESSIQRTQYFTQGDGFTYDSSSSSARGGTNKPGYMYIDDDTVGASYHYSNMMACEEGDIVYTSAYIKTFNTPSVNLNIRVSFYNAARSYINAYNTRTITAGAIGSYTKYEGTYTVPTGAAYVRMALGHAGGGTANAQWWIDDCCLSKSSQIIVHGTVGGARTVIDGDYIAGYSDSTTLQFYIDSSDGKAYFGAGACELAAAGLTLTEGTKGSIGFVYSGSYTGNGSGAARQITTGFQCKMVMIHGGSFSSAVATVGVWICQKTTLSWYVYDSDHLGETSSVKLHASNGFWVGGANDIANDNSETYNYIVVG